MESPGVDRRGQESFAEQLFEYGGHLLLLGNGAVVLNAEYDRVRGGDEGRLGDRLHHFPERDFGRERVAVIDDGLSVVAVPTVQFHAAATGQEDLEILESDREC